MAIRYREDKATQAAALLIKLEGGEMNHMKLIKILYLADRAALLQWGRPITFDWYVSMDHGPVLSFTLDRINSQPNPNNPTYWNSYISERLGDGHQIKLLKDVPNDQLSPAEEELLDRVYTQFGHMDQWDLGKYSHNLPEWHNPHGSILSIDIGDILLSAGFTEEDITDIKDALEAEAFADSLAD